jgi:hypothetical protein
LLVGLGLATPLLAGFDTSRSSIPVGEILSGGPPKDGIPALLRPRFVTAGEAAFLEPDDRVVGIARDGTAKAYPLRILNWHEVVNDEIGSAAVVVTYCPLTASAVAYDRDVNGEALTFGVSGRLYQSNVLLYDHRTESLWSQLRQEAVTGPQTGARLRALPSLLTSWAAWRREHPGTLVLSPETGYRRDYSRNPYASYERSPGIMFPPKRHDPRLPVKERVLGLEIGGQAKAYGLADLAAAGTLDDDVGGVAVRVEYDAASETVRVVGRAEGNLLPATTVYWFAWSAFHPETELWHQPPSFRGPPAPQGKAAGSSAVAIVAHSARWTDIFGLGLDAGDGGDSAGLLVVQGELENVSAEPLHHVKLGFELVDGEGQVVALEEGFNRQAETLRKLDSPVPGTPEAPAVATPIPAGGRDAFRMLFLRDETPPFDHYRIQVLATVSAE